MDSEEQMTRRMSSQIGNLKTEIIILRESNDKMIKELRWREQQICNLKKIIASQGEIIDSQRMLIASLQEKLAFCIQKIWSIFYSFDKNSV